MIPDSELVNTNQDAETFASNLFEALFNKVAPTQFITLIKNWAHWEGSSAQNNPMDTELPMVGSTDYNSVGVKNYPTLEDGINATIDTIRNGSYPFLESCMKSIGSSAVNQDWFNNLIHDINIWGTGNAQTYFPWTKDMLANPTKYLESFEGDIQTVPQSESDSPTNSQLESYDNSLNDALWEVKTTIHDAVEALYNITHNWVK